MSGFSLLRILPALLCSSCERKRRSVMSLFAIGDLYLNYRSVTGGMTASIRSGTKNVMN